MCRLPVLSAFLSLLIAFTTACSSAPPVKPLTIGSQVDFSALEDQNGNAFTHEDVMQTLLFVDTMKAKNLVRDELATIDLSCLDAGRVVYLADISGMPSLISKLIAVPRMRDYDYPIWLDYSGLATDPLPTHENEVTYIQLDGTAIRTIEFIADAKVLHNRLVAQCGPAKQQMATY